MNVDAGLLGGSHFACKEDLGTASKYPLEFRQDNRWFALPRSYAAGQNWKRTNRHVLAAANHQMERTHPKCEFPKAAAFSPIDPCRLRLVLKDQFAYCRAATGYRFMLNG